MVLNGIRSAVPDSQITWLRVMICLLAKSTLAGSFPDTRVPWRAILGLSRALSEQPPHGDTRDRCSPWLFAIDVGDDLSIK